MSSHSVPRLLTHQAQLGLPPAAWHGDSLAPTLAFPMTPFKIHHVPSLGLSINNTPPPGATSKPGALSPGHPTLDGTCPGSRDTMANILATSGQGVPSLGVHPEVPCPPSGSCGRCLALPEAVGLGVHGCHLGSKVVQITLRAQPLQVDPTWQEHKKLWVD